ncbi:MAG: hypothetical protein IPN62_00525 [Flavobacteriales bacterium]|jgi:hypothetical protein|nr:hypothetical protein [Flavobacteriales bacterium]
MERHERYDPEDIEHLLSERSFDALLEEERAYVMRHLGGREEYENMRALLLHVRHDEQQREEIEGDEQTRDRVMGAFRAQQRPTWRIWLNSLASVFAIDEHRSYWKPALAFGSLAALIGLGVYLAVVLPGKGELELAEVRQVPQKTVTEPGSSKEPALTPVTPPSDVAAQPETAAAPPNAAEAVDRSVAIEHSSDNTGEVDAVVRNNEASLEEESQEDVVGAPVTGAVATVTVPAHAETVDLDDVRVVEVRELVTNQSMSNASGVQITKTKARTERSKGTVRQRSRNMANDPEVRGLLAQGW